MNCHDIRSALPFYLDGELAEPERAAFARHLTECADCRAHAHSERQLIEQVRQLRGALIPDPDSKARLIEQIRRTAPPQVPVRSRRPTRRVPVFALAAALLLAVALPGLWYVTSLWSDRNGASAQDFAELAAELHRHHQRGALPLDFSSADPAEVSDWFQGKLTFALRLPSYPDAGAGSKPYRLQGARLIELNNHDAAYVAYEMGVMPISLIAARQSDAEPSGEERIASRGLIFHYRSVGAYKVITWTDRGLSYALVSAFEGRGQQSCLVCHGADADRGLIDKLSL